MRHTEDDEANWSEALSILDGMPTEPAARKVRRQRRNLLLLITGLAVGTIGLALVVFLVVAPGSASSPGDEPLWREVTALVLAGVGIVLSGGVLVTVLRSNRRLHAWSSPLAPLTRSQRKELTRHVTGRVPVPPGRLRLARYAAEGLVSARVLVAQQCAVIVLLAGQWIGEPTTWRLVLLGILAAGSVPLAGVALRRTGQARRFLEEHPA